MRIKRKAAVGVALLVSLLIAAGGAAPALAGSGPTARLSHITARLTRVAGNTSTIFGGWTFTPNSAAANVTTKFAVPALTCTSTLSGVGPIAVMITGTSTFNAAGVVMECSGGAAAMAAAVVVDGTEVVSSHPVNAGDEVRAVITTSPTRTRAIVTDLTTGDAFKLTKSGPGATSSKEEIIDDSLVNTSTGAQLPVANFGDIEFIQGRVGHTSLGKVTPSARIDMETSTGVLQVMTGRLRGFRKHKFFTIWKHA